MLTELSSYKALQIHQRELADVEMRTMFEQDPNRFEHFSLSAAGLMLDYSKNRVTAETMRLLVDLADQSALTAQIQALFNGDLVNSTEQRPALHMALRHLKETPLLTKGVDVMPAIRQGLKQISTFVTDIRLGHWRGHSDQKIHDIVNIGIGGSDLGPGLVTEALEPFHQPGLRFHFVSNVDSASLGGLLWRLNPAQTLFVISSKSFATQETLYNAETAKIWLVDALGSAAVAKHFVAVTAKAELAKQFGVSEQGIFPIWDWVGGRFSVWSAIGLCVALAIGMDNFKSFLAGAHDMDQHFCEAPLVQNMPVLLGLIGIWYINFFHTRSLAIVPYAEGLRRFPAFLQQLEMESNGKGCDLQNQLVDYHTAPVIFGSAGSNGQHAFHQLLHQGTSIVPVDFILPINPTHEIRDHHRHLVANCLSQSQALMLGNQDQSGIPIYQRIYGNKPSNTIVLPKLDPQHLGALLALYEHKTFVQSVIWKINAFDQWGVELGKKLAGTIIGNLAGAVDCSHHDASTAGLIKLYCQQK